MELFNQIFSEESLTVIVYIAVLFLLGIIFGWLLRNAGVRRANKKLKEVESERFALKSQLDNVEKDSGLKGADMKRLNLELIETKTFSKKLTLEKNNLSSKINRLENSENLLKQEVDRLSSEFKILNGSYQSASLKAKRMSSELETKDNDIDALTASVAELEAKIAELVRVRQQENTNYTTQLSDLKKSLGNDNSQMLEVVEAREKEIENLNQQIITLRKDAKENLIMASNAVDTGEVDELKAKIEVLEAKVNDASQARNQQYETAIRALNFQLSKLRDKNEILENNSGENAIDAGEVKILEETIADLRAKNESLATNLGKENKTLQAQVAELQKALTVTNQGDESESLKAKNRELKKALAQNAALKQEIDGMADVQAKFERQKIGFRDMLLKQNQYIIRIEKLQSQLDQVEDMQDNLTSAAGTDSYDDQLKALEEALSAANTNLKSIEDEKISIAGELNGFKSKVSKLEQEKYQIEEEYSQKVAIIMSETRSTESATAEFEARIANLEKEKHELTTQIEALQLTVEASKSSNENTTVENNKELESLKLALVKLEAERKEEQVQFLKELNEMKDDHKEILGFESQKVETAQAENNRLIELMEDLKAQISNLETDKFAVEEDVDELGSEHQNQLTVMNQQLSTVRDENMKLQIEADELKTQLSETETSKFQAEEDATEIDADYQNQISIVNSQLSNVRDENMQLQQLVADLRAEMTAIETSKFEAEEDSDEQTEEHNNQLAVLNTQLSGVRDENMQLQQELDKLRAEMTAVETSKFEAEEDSDEQTEEHNNQLAVLNTQLSGVRDENMQLQQQLEDLKAEMTAVETSKFEAEEEANEIDADYQNRMTVANTQLSGVRDENMQLQQQLEDLKAEMTAIETSKFEAEEEANEQTADHSNQLTILNTQLSGVRDENMQLLEQLEDLKAKMTEVETSKFQAEEDANELGSDYQNQLAILNSQLSGVRDENMRLANDLTTVTHKLNQMKNIGSSGKSTGVVNENHAIMAARKAVTDLIGQTIPYATADEKDDLKLVNGIGSFIETKLNNLGLYTYEQIGAFDEDIIEKVTDAIQFFPGRIKRDKWAEQARKLDE